MLRARVGGFFRNTYGVGVDGICAVCRGPSPVGREICPQCVGQRDVLDGLTLDQSVIFTYAQGNLPEKHQSVHTVRAYKWSNPALRCVEDMSLTVRVGTELHSECIRSHVAGQWDSVTYVPSSSGRLGRHPVTALATAVFPVSEPDSNITRFLLEASTSSDAVALTEARAAGAIRFSVPDTYRSAVEGKRVLLVDDTWTSGASIQSAAAALKLAGAEVVTGVCVARWLSAHYTDHLALMKTLSEQYEPRVCPVSGAVCVDDAST